MFVEITDFDGHPWNLPNLDKKPNTFEAFVTVKEREALVNLLGLDFYNAFIEGLQEDPAADPPVVADEKYTIIRDGGDYSINDKGYHFGGLKGLLVPYVYSEWIKEDAQKYSGVGVVIPNAENAQVISPMNHIVKGWNEYVRKLGFASSYHYGYGSMIKTEHTLYGLLESNADYPDYQYNNPGLINTFNL